MFKLYTTEDKLTEFCLEGETWYDIIRNQKKIFVCNDSEEEIWDETNSVLMNLHRAEIEKENLEDFKMVKPLSGALLAEKWLMEL